MGIVPLDNLYTVERLPEPGTKTDAIDLTVQGGGPVPNALVAMSRLGLSTAIIAAVGDDPAGRQVVEELKREDIEHRLIKVQRQPSATAVGFVEKESGRRTMVLHRQIGIRTKDLETDNYPRPNILLLDGRDLEASLQLARWGRKAGARVVFEIGSQRDDVSAIFPMVDYLIVSDDFAYPFTHTEDPEVAVTRLHKVCPGHVVLTGGIGGAWGLEGDERYYQPAFRVKAVDTTGAGDAFLGGFCYGLIKDLSMAECLRVGAAIAALKCTKPGPRTGLPEPKQLQLFLKSNPEIHA
jgi:sugar/nucleoside kinase (ribokinase family)